MKRPILLSLLFLLLTAALFAQSFPPTGASSRCDNCVPSDRYTVVSGPSGVNVSDTVNYGGGLIKWKNSNGNDVTVPRPPSSTRSAAPNYSSKTFLSLLSGPNIDSKVKFTVGQFIPGQKYRLHYAVMATRLLSTTFGSEAVLEIETPNNPNNLFGAIIDLTFAKNQWKEIVAEFTATEESLIFILSGNTTVGSGIVNFDFAVQPLECILPLNGQVQLYSPKPVVMYPCQTVNLDLLVKKPWPAGAEVVWKYIPYKSGANISKNFVEHAGVDPDPYYAFYYNDANECYSLNDQTQSTAAVTVTYSPQQVPLTQGSNVAIKCPATQYLLKNKLALPSDSTRVRWFKNNNHQGTPIEGHGGMITTAGTYYAFFYSDEFGCYSTDVSTASVTVSFETPCCNATGQVVVSNMGYPLQLTCPATSVKGSGFLNYANVVANNPNLPAGVKIVWYNNASHQGNPIDVSANADIGPGTYYAFFKDVINNCFAVDKGLGVSTRYVQVVAGNCNSGPKLSLRVALQGASELDGEGSIMHANLQSYNTGNGVGLLPTVTPYGDSESCPEINNQASKTERVVDWIKVEVRDAANPSVVLESKSLLLKPDGYVQDIDGVEPVFSKQSGPVRIVVRHRNHLAVMSNPIQSFSSGTVIYDFTTALSQASNEFGDPVQMIQVNGFWCMQLGDLTANPDLAIDGADGTDFKVQFKAGVFDAYNRADTNMDGVVDGLDGSLFKINFLLGLYSSIINY